MKTQRWRPVRRNARQGEQRPRPTDPKRKENAKIDGGKFAPFNGLQECPCNYLSKPVDVHLRRLRGCRSSPCNYLSKPVDVHHWDKPAPMNARPDPDRTQKKRGLRHAPRKSVPICLASVYLERYSTAPKVAVMSTASNARFNPRPVRSDTPKLWGISFRMRLNYAPTGARTGKKQPTERHSANRYIVGKTFVLNILEILRKKI